MKQAVVHVHRGGPLLALVGNPNCGKTALFNRLTGSHQKVANAPEWHDWLEEIGFLPGEQVMVMTRALPGGDPLVVRVGSSTFALRRVEAACVQVSTEHGTAGEARA